MIDPWIFDSDNFDFSKDVEDVLLRNETIDKYLSMEHRDKYLFLVGPKGIGKTFLLKYKSYLLRQHHKRQHSYEIQFSPAVELAENLSFFSTQFSKDEILKFQSLDIWENIWKFVLLCVSCKTHGIDIENKIGLPDNDFSRASNVLTFLLSDRKSLLRTLNNSMPKLIAASGSIKSAIAIFIDGIDFAINSFVDRKFYDYETYDDTALKVWTNIHVGIAKSIFDISKLNAHIKIHTTLRSEAFRLIPGGMGLNLEGFAIHLIYSPSELKEIFNNNIRLMNKSKLFNQNAEGLLEKFMGFGQMPHPFAKGRTESALDFLLRHTMGRPREIVFLGNKLYNEKLSKIDYKNIKEQDRIEDIRYFVNEKSEEILGHYLKEIIPSFDEEYLIRFLSKVQSNIFHHNILNDQDKNFLGLCYNIGLIGVINYRTNREGLKIQVQHFRKAGDYVYHNINHFPKSDYYITHPILDCYMMKLFKLDFYNNINIIGNDYEFKDPGYLYDFAISYSTNDAGLVESITSELKAKNKKIFYDKDHEKEYIGEDLIDYLYNVYNKSARNVIIFFSDNYLQTKWTTLEFNVIKQRLVNDFNSRFIKIVRIGQAHIPGIMETRSYIDAQTKSPAEIAELLLNY